MAVIVRETLTRTDDARSLLRSIYQNEADLIPDAENQTLTVFFDYRVEAIVLERHMADI